MYNQRTSTRQNTRFSRSNRGGGFRTQQSRFSGRRVGGRGRGRGVRLDIASFINKAVSAPQPEKIFVPEFSFEDFKLSPALLRTTQQRGYLNPTPIQDKIIPSIMLGKDVVGLANTGTGKTAAFLVPLIEKVLKNQNEQILIVTPTRELAQQIEEELKSIVQNMRVYSVTCVGGENIRLQIKKLHYKNNFIIGTPGRLIDLVNRGNLVLGGVRTVVLDEADLMLDMGFVKDIRLLMTRVPKERQTLCFSATMSPTIELLIRDFLKNPITISVKKAETPDNIEQDIIKVGNSNKVDALHDLLIDSEFKKVLVFGRTKYGVENLSRTLKKRGLKVDSIHGNKSQAQRKRALANFKENRVQALLATDVAARGLHIDNITHVINYEIPETYDDYIHRIGRTGRGDKQGKALTFID